MRTSRPGSGEAEEEPGGAAGPSYGRCWSSVARLGEMEEAETRGRVRAWPRPGGWGRTPEGRGIMELP